MSREFDQVSNFRNLREPIRSQFVVTRDGVEVVRQLTPEAQEKLGIKSPEPITTPEGFRIYGVNDTSLIDSLTSLNGIPIEELEARMRPGKGISMSGFLREGESLNQVLAKDNDTVLGMGLTHQQLAEFLKYFMTVGNIVRGLLGGEMGYIRFEFNNRNYAFWDESWRGIQESPFDDGTRTSADYYLMSLEDGKIIHYSGLLPEMIARYGFYEGQVSYRVDPKDIAEMAGFIPKPEDDPVAQLVKDPNAAVEITTSEQIWRLRNLKSVGLDRINVQNYRFVPKDFDTLLTLLRLLNDFGKRDNKYYEQTEELSAREIEYIKNIIGHIDTSHLTPQDVTLSGDGIQILANLANIMYDFPELKEVVLTKIKSIDFNQISKLEQEIFVEATLEAVMKIGPDDEDYPYKEYLQRLLAKVTLTPDNLLLIYKRAANIYRAEWRLYGPKGTITINPVDNDEELKNIENAIEETLPAFRERFISLCQQLGMPIPTEMSIADLIKQKDNIDNHRKAIEAAQRAQKLSIEAAINFAQRLGGPKQISETDMGLLISTLARIREAELSGGPSYELTPEEMVVAKKLKIDPSLLYYAWKAAGGANPTADLLVAQLYNGAAQKVRDLEQALRQLPYNMDENARKATHTLLKAIKEDSILSKQVDTQELINRLTDKARELQKRGKPHESEQTYLTEKDVLDEYLGLLLPPFREFLTSPLVRKALTRHPIEPVEASLDPEVLATIPEEEVTDSSYRTQKLRKVNIGGKEFVIDKYSIKTGDFILRVVSGNKIPLYLEKV